MHSMANIDKNHIDSAQSTPRSSITDASGSTRSHGSGSSTGSSNYSFLQRKLKIPPDMNAMDAAVLEAPLVRRPLPQKLAPISVETQINSSIVEIISNKNEGFLSSKDSTYPSDRVNKGGDILPHPPTTAKPRNGIRRGSNQSISTTTTPEYNIKDAYVTSGQDDKENNFSKVDMPDSIQRTFPNTKKDNINRKSDDEVSLVNSYESYLRQLSKQEEEEEEENNETCHDDRKVQSDDESSGSDYESDSSSYSISVSSLSGDEEDENLSSLTVDCYTQKEEDKFEPLYSLPMKSKKTDHSLKLSDNLQNDTLNESSLLGMSQHKYAVLNESVQSDELRTQSVPDLRNGRSFRTSDTLGYLCPKVMQLMSEQNTTSSPELKKTNFNLKYRPLPDIPSVSKIAKSFDRTENGDTIYEQIKTREMSQNFGSPAKSKISFKAIADRVVSLMPRLTTKEARNRDADKLMADIFRYLPDKTLRVYCGTWNMKGIKVVPETLDDYILPHESEFIQDIYAIGCQEGTPFRKEWEIRLQETLGPTHVLMYSGNFGVLHLSIFIRRELVWFCTGIEQDTIATRIAHKIKTKGAIAVCFTVFGTSLLFINSHFASNQEKLKERVNDYRSICRSLTIPFGEGDNASREADVTSRFDRVFWFGDFNFRVNKKRSETDELFANKSFENNDERKKHIVTELLQHDQLCQLIDKGKIFHGFKESPITFLPTYKFDVNSDSYDTSAKARVPSWTDRILFKSRQPDQIRVAAYNSCTTIKCSDHRPVYCIMEAKIEPIKKNVLLPVAMFDRDIYVEANLRRSAPKGSQNASNICTIL